MTRMILGRLVAGIVTLLVASMLIFAATELLPGDVATSALGRDATPERIEALRDELGLDRPAVVRYGDWLAGVVQLDFGRSLVNSVPVTELIGHRLANSGLLLLFTIILLIPLSLFLGTISALRQGRPLDTTIQLATLLGIALPEFVVGVVLALLFAVTWPILPAVSFNVTPASMVLPCATLIVLSLAYTARMVRAGVTEALSSEYVAMARLKGMPERLVVRRHVLPNALGPSFHAFALTIAWLAGGIVIVEYLFAYPGVGQALVDAVTSRDAPTVEALALVVAAVYVIGNLAADVLTVLVTPRLRTEL